MAKDREQYQKRLELGLCPQCGKERDDSRITCSACRNRHNKQQRSLRTKSESVRDREKNIYYRNQAKTIKAYGGRCTCCGESYLPYLELDHINGGGMEHRKILGLTGHSYYYWFERNNYPPIVQVLCSNCHSAKTRGYQCREHTKED